MRPALPNPSARLVGRVAAACALVLTACGPLETPAQAPAPAPAASAAPAASNPLHTLTRQRSTVRGSVREVLVTGHYTYVRIAPDDDGDTPAAWVVTMNESHQLGERVEARVFGSKRGFESARLGRTFDLLHFGVIDGPAKLSLR